MSLLQKRPIILIIGTNDKVCLVKQCHGIQKTHKMPYIGMGWLRLVGSLKL